MSSPDSGVQINIHPPSAPVNLLLLRSKDSSDRVGFPLHPFCLIRFITSVPAEVLVNIDCRRLQISTVVLIFDPLQSSSTCIICSHYVCSSHVLQKARGKGFQETLTAEAVAVASEGDDHTAASCCDDVAPVTCKVMALVLCLLACCCEWATAGLPPCYRLAVVAAAGHGCLALDIVGQHFQQRPWATIKLINFI
ncbi:hypothetical protein NE237_010396 [Protea cynaroides]|uniref:Uncharacterized protein n=1 Tax=Protea cynaroides TaxID=273540 RepID=A0A9Q0KZN9_9MAGN|nr:hypothetical protein NE237_010396 [Protea cynaroides]